MALKYASQVHFAQQNQQGDVLASLMAIQDGHVKPLLSALNHTSSWEDQITKNIAKKGPWAEMVVAHVQVLLQRNDNIYEDAPSSTAPPLVAYEQQSKLSSTFVRWFSSTNNNRWALPVLFTICQDLRKIALAADAYLARHGAKPTKLEDAASRHFMKGFSVCIADRGAGLETSRRWGTYHMANLLFKTYFKLKALALCKNIKRAVDSASDLPALELFPVRDQVSYRYHQGVYLFLNEMYREAEEDLEFAFLNCPDSSLFLPNQELILSYLVPLRMMRGVLPSPKTLNDHPNLRLIYMPLREAIIAGDLKKYEATLFWAEKRLLARGTYLAVESAREVCLRRLLKKIWLCAQTPGEQPNSKVDLALFRAGLQFNGIDVDADEVECILANMIFKNHIKGYLSHAHQKIVLSPKAPFPPITTSQ